MRNRVFRSFFNIRITLHRENQHAATCSNQCILKDDLQIQFVSNAKNVNQVLLLKRLLVLSLLFLSTHE